MSDTAAELVARSNTLGADPRNTNYAGGNTSAKGTETDPVTGQPTELLWVKGSGGDLGTLTESGLAVLRLDRMRALVDVYPGVEREDEMVAAFDFCLHGRGGASPSIDTGLGGSVSTRNSDARKVSTRASRPSAAFIQAPASAPRERPVTTWTTRSRLTGLASSITSTPPR